MYIVAIGVLESGYGNSNYAQQRNNTFGYGADTTNPDNAWSFSSQKEAIKKLVDTLKNSYLTPGKSWQYNAIIEAGYDPTTIAGIAYIYADGAHNNNTQTYENSIKSIMKDIFGQYGDLSGSSSSGGTESNMPSGGTVSNMPSSGMLLETSEGQLICYENGTEIDDDDDMPTAPEGSMNDQIIWWCKYVMNNIRNRNPKVKYSVENPGDPPLIWGDIERCWNECRGICCSTYLSFVLWLSGACPEDYINSMNYHYTGDQSAHFQNSPYLKRIDPKDAKPGDILLHTPGKDGHAMIYAGNGMVYDQRTCAVRDGQSWADGPHAMNYPVSSCEVYRVVTQNTSNSGKTGKNK